MKKVIMVVLILSVCSVAYAFRICQTDWNCVSDCTSSGYQWGYCKSICSWCN